MLDMSWGEVMVIGAVALIVIGPKDLPKALRTVGQMVGKVRRMASEFQGQFNEAMREAELDEVKRQIQGVNDSVGSLNTNFNPIQTVRDELKNSVESAGTTPTPGVADAPAPANGSALNAAAAEPVDPLLALPVPPVPAVSDPAESIARAAEQPAPPVVPPAVEPRTADVKASEKAE
jgi:sec-independent protein translocase protein TatB